MTSVGYFPVVKSFVATQALSRALEAAYGLKDAQCELIQSSMRDVYLITAGQETYVLFLYRHNQRSVAEITAEWDFIDYLKAGGASVAPAIRQLNGELILPVPAPEGERYAVLGIFAAGQHLRHRYSSKAAENYGRAIAQIHNLADAMPHSLPRPVHDFDLVVTQSLSALEPVLVHRPADMDYLREVAQILQHRFAGLPTHRPEYGMIHGDVIRANAQVSLTEEITVLDFDLCGQGWRMYDVASFLQVAGTEEAKQVFLNGYREMREISDEEMSWLALFEAARHIAELGVPAMNLYHWGRAYLNDSIIDAALNDLKRNMGKLD